MICKNEMGKHINGIWREYKKQKFLGLDKGKYIIYETFTQIWRFLELYEQKRTFTGKDVKVDNLEIATGDITDIHIGFDDVFAGWEDGAAPWNKPLRAI